MSLTIIQFLFDYTGSNSTARIKDSGLVFFSVIVSYSKGLFYFLLGFFCLFSLFLFISYF